MTSSERAFTSVEICAGAGGQAIGLGNADFQHLALVEIDPHACATLRKGFAEHAERVFEGDVRKFLAAMRLRNDPSADLDGLEEEQRRFLKVAEADHEQYENLDVLAGGVPCPPFSLAGKQLGEKDERDLFPTIVQLAEVLQPKAVMIENVRGLLQAKFDDYRARICSWLEEKGLDYETMVWEQFQASEFGVPQLRPRSILIALKRQYAPFYTPPTPDLDRTVTVGDALAASMRERGMSAAEARKWAAQADQVAPTLVGGSRKHGGADLGPTRAKRQWELLGVDGHGLADDNDRAELNGPKGRGPKLTVAQAAILQGFPPDWPFQGGKTARYRQVGNAFPPPVAQAVATQIRLAIEAFERGDEPPARNLEPGLEVPVQRVARRAPRRSKAAQNEDQGVLLF